MTKVLVTGANGHVGANTVRSLLARGYDVIPMVRETSDLRGLDRLSLGFRYADVLDADAVRAAMEGCDVVVHCAAKYASWAKDPSEIMAPCVTGTRNVFEAAKEAGVGRIVYTSSVAAVGFVDSPDKVRTADDWNEDAKLPYVVAKTQSERQAIDLAAEKGIDTLRLCPAYVLGPWDYRLTPSMKLLLDLVNGNGVTYRGGVNLVHAFDVGEAHAEAVAKGDAGARYIVCGENVDVRRLGDLVHQWTGIIPRHMGLPRSALLAAGSALDAISKLTGRPPQFSRDMAYENVHRYQYFDDRETNRAFDLSPKSADETVRDAVRWLLHIGAIKRELAPDVAAMLAPDPEWP